ncbi:MAG: acetyl-CoA carboxylase, biotin carboxyl carrier protein [Alphaproteobacteria bacterium]|nr:acetyl-CoA carboxylase, biotin carboxyl carrier protein [Alphaproteobacteria bacterium]
MDKQAESIIKDLANLLRETGLSEIDYEKDGLRLRVASNTLTPVPVAATPVAETKPESKPEEQPKNYVNSPIVGVVYLSPNPNAPTFVKVGDTVKVGQTLCMVEAMKTFNPVVAEKAGKIKAVLVESGAPVEYQQPLFEME